MVTSPTRDVITGMVDETAGRLLEAFGRLSASKSQTAKGEVAPGTSTTS
jgi:hypothetical protein